MKEKRPRSAEQSRKEILAAAERQFGEKGYYGARIDAIAKEAGMNKNMLYIHFESKEGLYRHVLLDMYRRIENVERELLERELQGRELVAAVIEAYFDFLNRNPAFVNILMNENLMQAEFVNRLPEESVARGTLDELARRIGQACRAGVFRGDIDAKQTVLTMITICFSSFSNRCTLSKLMGCDLRDEAAVEARKKQTIDIMLSYLTPKTINGEVKEP